MTTVTATRFGKESTYSVRVWEKGDKRIAYVTSGNTKGNLEYDLVAQAFRKCHKEIADSVIREQIENQIKGM